MAGHISGTNSGYRERNTTADRALDILLMFDERHLVLTAAEVAAHLAVGRSTAYRYLQSLTQTGFLEDADGSGYRLGSRVMELARLARRGFGLSEIARPIMRRLATTVGETVLLTRLTGDRVICLEREDSGSRAVRITYERGEILPINAGASAFSLLSWLSDAAVDDILDTTHLEGFTARTPVTKRALLARLQQTREQGYAVSRGELDPDVLGIAAPVHGADGDVVAAVSIAALSTRVPDARVPDLAVAVLAAAAEITANLNG
ncbi:IclR family transcriptional regulator [Nocardia brasiliensis]|uniref:IclR family transcriptional regulator n=1 Tax=Nocardia brasiliensis TaxID=37326 RepID=UPI0009DDFDDD|nr:IclR family transcriptional regulator [Nocardia brasiliensis]ASF12873.1 IclR family transcriptional regulator [Nocardia brasiliensis]